MIACLSSPVTNVWYPAVRYHGHSGIEVHGQNGVGNVPLPYAPNMHPAEGHAHADAAAYLLDTCSRHPGQVTIVALGPMTNLGLALQRDARLGTMAKRMVCMAGTVDGRGNKQPHAEANVHNDPEAASMAFTMFKHVTMSGLNLTSQLELSSVFRGRVRDTCGAVGDFIFRMTQHYVDLLASWGNTFIPIHDSSAVMAVLRPDLFPRTADVHVDVETTGKLTRGCTVADWLGHWGKPRNTCVLLEVKPAAFVETYLEYVAEWKDVKW